MLLATVLAVVAASGPATVIRTGGPSAPQDPKVAIVGGGRPRQKFSVTRKGRVVQRGRLRKVAGDPGPWSSAAAADLRLTAPGRYIVHVGTLKSRPWDVDPGAQTAAILRLLRIYAVNADGNEPNPVFGPAHLNDAFLDGTTQRLDLTGGWRDAGDQLKFTRTIAQSVAYLQIAARLAPGTSPALKEASAVGERYLLKAHTDGLFIGTVGDERDHETGFRDPATDDANTQQGVGIRYAYPTVSSDVLGETAAALALSGHVEEARAWYAQARQTNGFAQADREFYPDDSFHDELAFAADALWRATGDDTYLQQAYEQLQAGSDDEFYGGVVTGAPRAIVDADLCGGLGAPAAPDGPIKDKACGDVRSALGAIRERANHRAFGSPGIYTFGFIQDNSGAGVIAAAAQRAGIGDDGERIAAAARDYLTGRNQWGRSFIVGTKRYESHNPHHSAYLEGTAAKLLDGAVVGGPAKPSDITGEGLKLLTSPFNGAGVYDDDTRADYVTSEVGLAYSAPAILLAALLN